MRSRHVWTKKAKRRESQQVQQGCTASSGRAGGGAQDFSDCRADFAPLSRTFQSLDLSSMPAKGHCCPNSDFLFGASVPQTTSHCRSVKARDNPVTWALLFPKCIEVETDLEATCNLPKVLGPGSGRGRTGMRSSDPKSRAYSPRQGLATAAHRANLAACLFIWPVSPLVSCSWFSHS